MSKCGAVSSWEKQTGYILLQWHSEPNSLLCYEEAPAPSSSAAWLFSIQEMKNSKWPRGTQAMKMEEARGEHWEWSENLPSIHIRVCAKYAVHSNGRICWKSQQKLLQTWLSLCLIALLTPSWTGSLNPGEWSNTVASGGQEVPAFQKVRTWVSKFAEPTVMMTKVITWPF